MKYTDKQLLDFLQKKNSERMYTGNCVFRISDTGRGWRLHESSRKKGRESVREAIADGIDKEKKEEK